MRRIVNASVGVVVEDFEPGHPSHGFRFVSGWGGAYGRPADAIALAEHVAASTNNVLQITVRIRDVVTHEEWFVPVNTPRRSL